MTVKFCDSCNQRYTFAANSGDYVHTCTTSSKVLSEEDVFKVGEFSSEFGETVDTGIKKGNMLLQGSANRLWGGLADLEGEHFGGVTSRGKPKQLYRQRQRFKYIENPDEGCDDLEVEFNGET